MANSYRRVVGISGVTCGGKTTLATKLLQTLPTTTAYLCQDDYLFPDDYQGHLRVPKPLEGHNKESLCSIDMVNMLKDIEDILTFSGPFTSAKDSSILSPITEEMSKLLSRSTSFKICLRESELPPVLLLDGFLIFNQPEVPPVCDLLYFFILTKNQCWKRRKNRIYPMQCADVGPYFELCVWPKYRENFKQMYGVVNDICFLDGASELDALHCRVFKDVINMLETSSKQ